MTSSSLIIVWVILSVVWLIIVLVIIDKFQKSRRRNTLNNTKRIRELEEKNKIFRDNQD